MDGRGHCQNQDLQDKRTCSIQSPQPQRGGMCVEKRSHLYLKMSILLVAVKSPAVSV